MKQKSFRVFCGCIPGLAFGVRREGVGGWTARLLVGVVCGFGVCGTAWGQGELPSSVSPHEEVYQRASAEFKTAVLYKPVESKNADLAFTPAPWILQETGGQGAGNGMGQGDRFGSLDWSNGVPVVDVSRPTIYVLADTVQIMGKTLPRFTYLWSYAGETERCGKTNVSGSSAQGILPGRDMTGGTAAFTAGVKPTVGKPGGVPGQPVAGFALQGVRMTLGSAGRPVVWEVLADSSGVEVIFVSRSLESAALAEFGKPLAGRRYSVEPGVKESPNVVVARVIEDGPIAMGPMVYLSAGSRSVSTLICRCMAAQAKQLVESRNYELASVPVGFADPGLTRAKAQIGSRPAFWPGDEQSDGRIEKCLRLPEKL